MNQSAVARHARKVEQIADLLRQVGRTEEEVQQFIRRALARRDRRMLAYFTRRYLGFWHDVFGTALRDDIIERTQRLYDHLLARMHHARDAAAGWHIAAIPRSMQMTRYHYVPFVARGYERVAFKIGQNTARLLVLPSRDELDEALHVVRLLSSDPRSADVARYLLAAADDQGNVVLRPRYYDAFGWDERYARRYAHFALSRLRQEGYIVLVRPGRLYDSSHNRIVSPQLMRFALDAHDAIMRAIEDEEKEEEENNERREDEPALAVA